MNWLPLILTGFVGLAFGWLGTVFFNRKQMIDELSALAGVRDKLDPQSSEYREVSKVVRFQAFRVVALIRYPPLLRPEFVFLIVSLMAGTLGFLLLVQMRGLPAGNLESYRVEWVSVTGFSSLMTPLFTFLFIRTWSIRAKKRIQYIDKNIDDKDEMGDVLEVMQAAQAGLVLLLGLAIAVNFIGLAYAILNSSDRSELAPVFMLLGGILGVFAPFLLGATKKYTLAPTPSSARLKRKVK